LGQLSPCWIRQCKATRRADPSLAFGIGQRRVRRTRASSRSWRRHRRP